ncbi:MAG: hypothetical protein Q8Q09_28855 [Deltaproteobacteria bacterium]|nr:hypothetical protein [Deltaproteobacteria bacterium]
MAYRDDRQALEERRAKLENQLASLRSQIAGNSALESELLTATTELEMLYAKLNATTPSGNLRRNLPLLQQLYVASPCNVPWESMHGDDRVRLCDLCDKKVYDLSALTTHEAEQLIRDNNANVCVQFYRRTDGTILTKDCPVGVAKKKRTRRKAAVVAVAVSAAAAGAALFGLRERVENDQPLSVPCQAITELKPSQPNTTQELPVQVTPAVDPSENPAFVGQQMRGGAMAIHRPLNAPILRRR